MFEFDSPRTSLSGKSDDVLLSSGLFKISLLSDSLVVFSIPHNNIPKCAWWLVREFCMRRTPSSFSLLLGDEDGLSVVCNSTSYSTLQLLVHPQDVVRCENLWRAVVIEISTQSDELPNTVYTLVNALSSKGVSILHISTFESEVFLVQEKDLSLTCEVLKAFEQMPPPQSYPHSLSY
ncbi:ACT domain-containing protein, partial [archaeon]